MSELQAVQLPAKPRALTELQYYILASELSPPAWDTLKAICRYLILRGEEDIPHELLMWNLLGQTLALRPRPAEVPAPRNRLRKLGYILRNNEIRHTVNLLDPSGYAEDCRLPSSGGRHPS